MDFGQQSVEIAVGGIGVREGAAQQTATMDCDRQIASGMALDFRRVCRVGMSVLLRI